MRKVKLLLEQIIAFFYTPFKRFMPIETFRYAFNGGVNTSLDIFLYFVFYNYILGKDDVSFFIITVSPHIAAFIIVFPITFTTGFLLSKFITFTQSSLHGRIQLFRYVVVVAICIFLNYVFIKIFVEFLNIYPTPSKILTTIVVVLFSYFAQKYYTFKEDRTIA